LFCNRHETMNIEYRTRNRRITKKVTSTFDIPCSIFCGSEKVLIQPIVAIPTASSISKNQCQWWGKQTFYETILVNRHPVG
jgi:ABC-type antimicrobial peptide transport system ATPase subunit